VPAIGETITRSSAKIALTKLDLPTLGRPITAKLVIFAVSTAFLSPNLTIT